MVFVSMTTAVGRCAFAMCGALAGIALHGGVCSVSACQRCNEPSVTCRYNTTVVRQVGLSGCSISTAVAQAVKKNDVASFLCLLSFAS